MELDNRRVGLKRKLVDRSKLKYGKIKIKKKKKKLVMMKIITII